MPASVGKTRREPTTAGRNGIHSGYAYAGPEEQDFFRFDPSTAFYVIDRQDEVADRPLIFDLYMFYSLDIHGSGYSVLFGDSAVLFISSDEELTDLIDDVNALASSSDDPVYHLPVLDYFADVHAGIK